CSRDPYWGDRFDSW
nr:immunoglobulin heavy chain junction region [Macaca mulatta]MOW84117.1 immunoglobulin heavy chain junction region [Macaca mulatta]MOW85018.1 immunoglobulin heavy chain junction region [Macaca mulatta]